MGLKAAIYARVSTRQQNPDHQLQKARDLIKSRGWEKVAEYIEYASTKTRRPQKEMLMKAAIRRDFDIVVVWSLDRLSRSLPELVRDVEHFRTTGVQLVSIKEAIDTSTQTGRMLLYLIGILAEFERALISERVKSGIEAARVRGVRLGRPPKVNPQLITEMLRMRKQGATLRSIAQQFNMHPATVCRALKPFKENEDANKPL